MTCFLLANGRTLTQACQYVGYVNHKICESVRKIHSAIAEKGLALLSKID